MNITDEDLMAYADGELPPAEAKRIESAMAEDTALAARVARFRRVRRALRTAYDSVVSEPIPEHLRALLGDVAAHEPDDTPAAVVDLAVAREQRAVRFGPPAWAAMAASLIVGVLVGRTLLSPSDEIFTRDGLYASAGLARALDTQLASEAQDGATRIGVTFRTRDDEICRTFARDARGGVVSGLACRDDNRWGVRVALTETGGAGGAYRQAGAEAPAILEAVDAMIDGEAFDAEQERAARDLEWETP
jgi:hypothetical protein